MKLNKAPEIPIRHSPEVVRGLYQRLERVIIEQRERFGADDELTKMEQSAIDKFQDAFYFMHPFEKGAARRALPGITIDLANKISPPFAHG